MAEADDRTENALAGLRWQAALSRAGLVAERAARAFWPLFSLVLLVLAGLLFGLHERLAVDLAWAAAVAVALGCALALAFGLRRFRWPTRAEALARIDRRLPGRPIAAILDRQAIGTGDPASQAVWRAHVERMAARARAARAPAPAPDLPARDPYGVRYVALLAFVTALIFGSVFRLATVGDSLSGGRPGGALAAGPAWEGWIEPPAHTGRPTLYLPDATGARLAVAQGSKVTLRLYGEVGALIVEETVSGRTGAPGSAADARQVFRVARSGRLAIDGPGGRSWEIDAIADRPPEVAVAGEVSHSAAGELKLPFSASDDYGVRSGRAEIALDLGAVDRRHGLVPDPEPRAPIVLDLPMPFNGDRRKIEETLSEDLTRHPWVGLPVTVRLSVEDAAGQKGASQPYRMTLPGRHFFNPLAAAIVEQRRDLLWNRSNGRRVARILRALSNRPDDLFRDAAVYLRLRQVIRELEGAAGAHRPMPGVLRDRLAGVLWTIALDIEDGNLGDARARLQEAQKRLRQAMRDGANDEEIRRLMNALDQAMQDYLRQLAQEQRQQRGDTRQQADNGNTQEITGEQLQQLLDRLQQLMQEGRMSEAEQLLEQLGKLMENLQVTEGGQGRQGRGQQALEGLADTLRRQQGLSDQTFRDLQKRFGDGQPDGQNDGQNGQNNRNGQQGQDGPQGQGGQQGQDGPQGQGGARGQPGGDGPGGDRPRGQLPGRGGGDAQGLAERQQALIDRLREQMRNMPGTGRRTVPGPGAGNDRGQDGGRGALDDAERAMRGAEKALRDGDLSGALDRQADALEALRQGMRDLAEQLAGEPTSQTGEQGRGNGAGGPQDSRDPLGRSAGAAGRIGTDRQLLQGEDVYRRARELLDEIRRRASQRDRPEDERNYLRRLLGQF